MSDEHRYTDQEIAAIFEQAGTTRSVNRILQMFSVI